MSDETGVTVPVSERLLLTVPEAAALAGIPRRRLQEAVRDGRIPSCYVGSARRRIRRTDLDAYVRDLPEEPGG